jgi:hypothetical protein
VLALNPGASDISPHVRQEKTGTKWIESIYRVNIEDYTMAPVTSSESSEIGIMSSLQQNEQHQMFSEREG